MVRNPKQVVLSPVASKVIPSLSPHLKQSIADAIRQLAENPLIGIPLKGPFKGLRRKRVGDFRIVYRFTGNTVEIVNIGDRKDIYRL